MTWRKVRRRPRREVMTDRSKSRGNPARIKGLTEKDLSAAQKDRSAKKETTDFQTRVKEALKFFDESDFKDFEFLRKFEGFVVLGNGPQEQREYPDNFCVVRLNNYIKFDSNFVHLHFIGGSKKHGLKPDDFLPELNNSNFVVCARELKSSLDKTLEECNKKILVPVCFYDKAKVMKFLQKVFHQKNSRKLWISGLHALVLFYVLSQQFEKKLFFDGFTENKLVDDKCLYYFGERKLSQADKKRHVERHDWGTQMKFVEFLREEYDQNQKH